MSTRHPLEDHPYHNKTDAELRYIVKDAGEAARAMKDHSPQAESKYLDQVNDASTVLNFRKNGMPDWYKEKYGHNVKKESKSFTEMLEAYDTHGLSVFSNNLTEEPDNEQFTKELRAQEAKAAGRAPQAEVAKGAVKGVKIQNGGEVKEEVEQIDELSRETLTNYKNQSIPSYEELVGKAITAKTPEEFKKYRIKAKNRATGTLGAAERLGKMGEEVEQIDEGSSTSRTPWRDINSPEFKKLSQNIRRRSEEEDAAKPGKTLLAKINARTNTNKKIKEEVELDDEVLDEMLSEVLTKDDTAAEFIHDFVHSDDPRFKDSSKKERIQRALAAYYKKQRER